MKRLRHLLTLALALMLSIGAWAQGSVTVQQDADLNWGFTMPGYDALMHVDYYPATLTLAVNNNGWGSVQYVPAEAPVVWRNGEVTFSGTTITGGGITSTCGAVNSSYFVLGGGGFFTHANKRLSKVEVYAGNATNMGGTGWNVTTNKAVWTGIATDTVSFTGMVNNVDSIVFTLADPNVVDNGNGTYAVIPGTVVTFIATPDSAHYFVNWNNGAAVNSNTAVTTTLTMGFNDTTVNANFAPKPTLTLAANDTAWGSVTIGAAGSAGGEVTIGDGTATCSHGPYNSLWYYSFVESLYTAEEIGTAGTITSISYNMKENTQPQTNDFVIYMKNVSRETFTSSTDFEPVTEADIVYSGSFTFNPGWSTITLDTPFEYDGTSTLMVAMHESTSGYSTRYFYFTSSSTARLISGHSDSQNPNPLDMSSYGGSTYTQNESINIKIDITPSTSNNIVALTDSTYRVDYGTEVTFNAEANDGYYMDSWSNGATVNNVVLASQTITVTSDTNITANFAQNPLLTLASNQGGTLAVVLPSNEPIIFTASSPASGTRSNDTVQVTLEGQLEYSSNFGWRSQYGDGNQGSITVTPLAGFSIESCRFVDGSGHSHTVTEAPFAIYPYNESSGFKFFTQPNAQGEQIYSFSGVKSIEVFYNVIASSTPNTYYIDYGTDVTVIANANQGYHMDSWSNGAAVNSLTEATQTLTVTSDTNITATFAPNPLLTLASNQGGTMKLVADTVFSNTNEEVQIGDGTGDQDYFPIANDFKYSCTEQIFTANEIGSAGTITSISLYYNQGTPYTASGVTMYLKHVTRSTFANSDDCEPLSSATDIVWTGSIAPTEAGWYTFTLDTPFEYNGTDNLLVAFVDPTNGKPGSSHGWRSTQSPNGAQMALRYYSDEYAPTPTSFGSLSGTNHGTVDYRTNIKIGIEISSFTTPGVVQLTDSTYRVDYGTDVTVKATPDRVHYLANFDSTDVRNDNDTAIKVYTNITANTTATANFATKPVLTLARNNGGTLAAVLPSPIIFTASAPASGTRGNDTVQVTFEGQLNYDSYFGWEAQYGDGNHGSITVTAANGFTIDRCTFRFSNGGSYTVYQAPFAVYPFSISSALRIYNRPNGQGNLLCDYGGVVSIEVFADHGTPSIIAAATPNTYYIKYGGDVTVKATPDATHYLANFNSTDVRNSNVAVDNTFTVTADTTLTANFATIPILTLAANDTTMGSIVMGEVSLDAYRNALTSQALFGQMTVIDVNGHEEYNEGTWRYSGIDYVVEYAAQETKSGDDWLITPTIAMESGKTYTISFNARGSASWITEKFEVKAATEASSAALSAGTQVRAATNVNHDSWRTYSGTFTPTESGNYYVGIHAISTPDRMNLQVTNLAVTYLGRPAGVTQLTDSTYRVLPGTEVPVKATAITMHHVAGWQNEDNNDYAGATYSNYAITTPENLFPLNSSLSLTVTGDTTAMAMFGINSYDLTAQVANTDDVRGTVSAAYTDVQGVSQTAADSDSLTVTAQGASTTTLTATPSWGYHFVGWLNAGGDTVSTSNPLGVTSSVDTALVALFDTTHAELAWDTNAFTGYTFIDFNNWKPTLDNPHSVNVRYGCVEGGLAIDAATGLIGTVGSYGHTVPATGSWHIYAVHDLSQEYFYDSVVYTLTVEQGVTVALQKNFVNRGNTTFPDYSTTGTLTTQYLSNIMAVVGQGNTIRVNAEPAEGYHFTEWRTGSTSTGYTFVSNDVLYTFTVPNAIATGIQAVFDTNVYNVVANAATDDRPGIGSGLAMGTATAGGRHMHFLYDTLTATDNYGYTFAGWVDNAGDTVSTDNPFIFSPVSDTTLTAVYTVNNFAVTALSADSTLGGVTGTDSIAYLAPDTLIATPVYGHRFTHWSNAAGDTVATTDTLVITVLSDTTLTAHFVIDQFTVTAVSNDTNMGTVAGTATVDYLDTVTLTATPLYGYHLVNWTEADSVFSTAESISVVANADRTLTANFAINTYLLTLAADADSMGVMSVALADTGSAGHPAGSGQLTICDGTATNGNVPAYGFYADAYLKAEMVYPASMLTDMPAGTEISKMTFYAANPTISWTSTWQVFLTEVADETINAYAGPGTVVYEGLLNVTGSEMTINFTTPYTYNGGNLLVGVYNITEGNYVSVTWTGVTSNGSSVQDYDYGNLNSVSPTQRNFLPKVTFDYAMEAADPVPPSGSFVAGSEPNTYIVEHGSELVITATANASYHMTGWSNGAEVNSLTTATQTVTIVSDSAITATFGVNPVLTLADTTNGTVAVSGDLPDFAIDNQDGSYSVLPGTAMSLVATPDAGYHVTGWSNGVEVNSLTAATQTVTVDSDTTLSATFGVNPVVTLAANGNGTVAAGTLPAFAIDNQDGTYSVLPGTAFTFVATPDTHYYMTRWDDIDSMVNSNTAVSRTETIDGDTAFTANFTHKPILTLTALPDTTWGWVTLDSTAISGGGSGSGESTEVTIGDGTSTTYHGPFNSLWGYSFVENLYTAEEIGMSGQSGMINSISFQLLESNQAQTNNITVYMKNVSRETFTGTTDFEPVTEADIVYSGSFTFTPGWSTITLDTPFEYDGTSTLMVGMHESTSGYSTRYFYYTSTPTARLISGHSDSQNPNPLDMASYSGSKYTANEIINIKLDITPITSTNIVALTDSTYVVDYGTDVNIMATSADSNSYYVLSWSNNVEVDSPFVARQTITMTTDTAISATFANSPVLTLAKNEDHGWIALEGSEIGENLDLSTLTNDTVVADGTTIYGTLAENVKVSIADGATVYLDGVTINGVSNIVYSWAGLTCLGDATIILDNDNSVQGFYENYPGIYVPEGSTLTIQGRGTLTATGSVYGAGIGGGLENSCGNIVIAGGTIVATGGSGSAAIGSGNNASCGTITITGGNVTANCGEYAAGIGSGMMGSCGAITIADSVTVVTSDAGVNANSIGAGFGGSVASVTIGTTTGAQTQNPYTYEGNGNGWTYGGLPDGVTNNHDGTYTIRYGVTVNVIATADEHHHVESWSNEVEVNNPSPANQWVRVTSDSTITVNFSIDHHAILAVMANDIMGETFGSDTVDYLDTVTLTATPATGYHFVNWTEADTIYGTDTVITVVAYSDRTFTAHMDTNVYGVLVAVHDDCTGMGTVTDTPDSVKHFLTADYTATPATGYHLTGWLDTAGTVVSTDNPLTVAPVSDTIIYAAFDTNAYVLTVLAADSTMGSVSGTDTAALHFLEYTITATPATCYEFVAWSDGDSNATRTVTLTSDSTIVAEFAYIARSGEETLVVCDSVVWNDSTYAISGDYAKVLQTSETCDSTATLHLTVKLSTSSTNTAVACENYTWHNVTYTSSTLAHYDTINAVGCDSIANLNLTINYSSTGVETVVTCDSVYEWNGITYVSSTTGYWHTTNMYGCDSTATLNLTLNNEFNSVQTVNACGTYTWVDGVTYTESTDTPTYVFEMANGCDSTVTLNLTISNTINTVETVTACDSFLWHGTTYTASTDEPTWFGTSVNDCDSIVTLHLTVNNSVADSFDANTCSYYIWDGSYYNETGSYTRHYTAANGCDSTSTLNLTVNQYANVAISDTSCGSYTWNGIEYTASGAYTQTFTRAGGCDSTVTLTLIVNQPTTATVMATACDTYEWHGVTYTETPAVDPTYTTTGSNGCDSVTTLHLVIAHSGNNVDSVTACGSYTWIDGITYTASTNEPSYTITGENCDVTVTLHLTINNGVEYSFNATTCSYYIWDGSYYNETGSYTRHYTAANGCDSTATLNLTVGQQTTVAINETACGSYTWNGTTYTGSGSYTQHFTGSNNCDSTVTLTLTINQPVAATETVMACDSFAWHGVTYTATPAVAPTFTATGSNGCDSVTTLNLTVAYSNSAIETVTACDSLLWHGTVYTADNNTATYSTTNAAGCDSTVTLNLTVNSSVASSFDTAACNYYVWDGSYYAQSGSYTKHYTAANGCDSAATLHLTVNHAVTATVRDTACDSYTWNGVTYAASGAYTQTLTGSTGCDSTVTLVLTINRSNNSIETVTACDNYTWHGTTYTASNSSATYTTTNAAGCDSTVTLHLTVNYSTASDEIVTACDSYTWHGNTYTASTNTATYTTTNAAGCDNVVTLNLTVNYSNSGTETVTACDSYTWHGTTYTASNNTATYTATNAAGCDSTVTLNLTVNYSTASTETVTACDSYTWHGTVYTASNNTATYTATNAAGCDSTVTLNLTVNHSTASTETVTACNAFFWHDSVYTASTTATYTTLNAAGCDSVTTLHLTINNCSTTEITVCDSYTWHGTVYTLSGTYYDGNDTLVLTVNYSTSAIETVTACDSYTWHGTTYTTSTNTPTWTTTNAVGCDSVVTLNLTIIHCSTSEITACDSYTWHGTVYTEGGTYYDGNDTLILTLHYSTTGDTTAMACDEFDWYEHTGLTEDVEGLTHLFTGANQWGCDSTVTLHLTVNYSHDTAFFMQAEGSIVWNGETFTESGVYVRTIQTVNGCDSVVTLTLAILPEGTPIPTIYNVMDVVIAVNHNEEGQEDVHYAWYRWYRNGALVLEGADIDSYSEGGSRLNGTYYLEVATSDSREFWVRSNELVIGDAAIDDVEGDISFSLSPNPAVYGQQVTVKVNASDSDLQGAELCVYDLQGRLVVKPVAVTRGIEATLNTGVYMVRITLKDGRSAVRRLVVR